MGNGARDAFREVAGRRSSSDNAPTAPSSTEECHGKPEGIRVRVRLDEQVTPRAWRVDGCGQRPFSQAEGRLSDSTFEHMRRRVLRRSAERTRLNSVHLVGGVEACG